MPLSWAMSSVIPPPLNSPLPVAAPVILSTAKRPTQRVPKTPLNRCTGTAPTGSSILNASSSFTAQTTSSPDSTPMSSEAPTVTNAHGAVIATRPASRPLIDMPRSGFPSHIQLSAVAESMAMNAAVFVVMKMCDIAPGSAAIVEPGLNPNHPSQSTKVPMTAEVMLWPGRGFTLPSGPILPMRGPRTRMPASAAQPPTLCTTVEPAKSQNPAVASQPPPQIQ